MNFEDMQRNWQSQPVDQPDEKQGLNKKLLSQWQQQQQQVKQTNILATAGFVGVFVVAGSIWLSFHAARSVFFTGSIFFVSALMLVYLWVIWKGVANKKSDTTVSTMEYIDQSIQKLFWRRKTLTTYKWTYSILLWIGMMLYLLDTTNGNLSSGIGIPIATTAYIFGMRLYLRNTKEKKQIVELDQLINDMQLLKTNIGQP